MITNAENEKDRSAFRILRLVRDKDGTAAIAYLSNGIVFVAFPSGLYVPFSFEEIDPGEVIRSCKFVESSEAQKTPHTEVVFSEQELRFIEIARQNLPIH